MAKVRVWGGGGGPGGGPPPPPPRGRAPPRPHPAPKPRRGFDAPLRQKGEGWSEGRFRAPSCHGRRDHVSAFNQASPKMHQPLLKVPARREVTPPVTGKGPVGGRRLLFSSPFCRRQRGWGCAKDLRTQQAEVLGNRVGTTLPPPHGG